jgi:hypothetical protein
MGPATQIVALISLLRRLPAALRNARLHHNLMLATPLYRPWQGAVCKIVTIQSRQLRIMSAVGAVIFRRLAPHPRLAAKTRNQVITGDSLRATKSLIRMHIDRFVL